MSGHAIAMLPNRARNERRPSGRRVIEREPWLWRCASSEEKRQVFAEQYVLVEQDRAPRDAPFLALAAKHVFALADQDVGLGLDPVAIDQETAAGRDFPR